MKMWQGWYQTARLRRDLAAWHECGALDARGLDYGRQLCATPITSGDWLAFWRQLCAWLGCVLLGSAVICLVAANWSQLGKFSRLAGLQGLLVLAVLVAMRPGVSPLARTASLLLASMLLGGLLALVGQTYQTGADPWQLFAGWAVLMLPWTLAARSVALWLVWAMVANVALGLWANEGGDERISAAVAVFSLFNGLLLAGWEAGWRRLAWLRRPLGPRLLASWLLGVLAWYAIIRSIELGSGFAQSQWIVAMSWWALVAVGIGVFYRYGRRDIAMMALVLVTLIAVFTTQVVARIDNWWDDSGGPLWFGLLAILVLVQAALAAAWLRRLASEHAS